ncbi:MAG: 30S ribosome-binding factor RbfA [Chlamydiales bacterium]|nr:30S ribosome-binding factor RbfA [Chlamydiia bacterium]MCP5507243.1 30S ribosome-binding factor RbfA [Chlamydiales bacterium]
MAKQRTDRLNSLLREVISDVIRRDVKNQMLTQLLTVTRVDISKDLRHAKVYVSVIGSDAEKNETIAILQAASGFIAVSSSKKVVMRHFPELLFRLDDSVDKHMRVEELLKQVNEEKTHREEKELDEHSS